MQFLDAEITRLQLSFGTAFKRLILGLANALSRCRYIALGLCIGVFWPARSAFFNTVYGFDQRWVSWFNLQPL